MDPGFTNGETKEVGCGEGVSSSPLGRGHRTLSRKFLFDFGSQIGGYRYILGTFFTVHLFGLNAFRLGKLCCMYAESKRDQNKPVGSYSLLWFCVK